MKIKIKILISFIITHEIYKNKNKEYIFLYIINYLTA